MLTVVPNTDLLIANLANPIISAIQLTSILHAALVWSPSPQADTHTCSHSLKLTHTNTHTNSHTHTHTHTHIHTHTYTHTLPPSNSLTHTRTHMHTHSLTTHTHTHTHTHKYAHTHIPPQTQNPSGMPLEDTSLPVEDTASVRSTVTWTYHHQWDTMMVVVRWRRSAQRPYM